MGKALMCVCVSVFMTRDARAYTLHTHTQTQAKRNDTLWPVRALWMRFMLIVFDGQTSIIPAVGWS